MVDRPETLPASVLRLLDADETIEVYAIARDQQVIVTDRRLAVADDERIALHIGHHQLRRVQFDIERQRPATLVIVPEDPADEPQVLSVPPERYDEVARALVALGHRIAT